MRHPAPSGLALANCAFALAIIGVVALGRRTRVTR